MPAIGTKLGPYEILQEIGAGGMGEVYRARDARIGRDVAIKLISSSIVTSKEKLHRFEQEARATGALNHPNILSIYDFGTSDGAPYVVTELLEGETLRKRLAAGAIPVRKVIDYAIQIAKGLTAAHSKGIVHRDLKPENIFITKDGRVKILDFGLAKLTQPEPTAANADNHETISRITDAGIIVGTVSYMSPEQIRGNKIDSRSDLFAFGVILYEMLSGKRPFAGHSNIETMNAILEKDPPEVSTTNPEISPALERIIHRCLEKDPDHRFQSTSDLAFALESMSVSSTRSLPIQVGKSRKKLHNAIIVFAIALATIGIYGLSKMTTVKSPTIDQSEASKAPYVIHQLTFRHGFLGNARFTADGQTILYSAEWSGNPAEIFFMRLGSPEARSLGVKDVDLYAVSPQGQLAVKLRSSQFESVMAQMPFGGGAPRELLKNVTAADWSPDGKNIAVIRGHNTIEFPIGKQLYKSDAWLNYHIRFSPDGKQIAFIEMTNPNGRIFVMDLNGKTKMLTEIPMYYIHLGLAWSPDGNEVWFAKASKAGNSVTISAVNLSGEEREILPMNGFPELLDIYKDGRILLSHGFIRHQLLWASSNDGIERDLSWLDGSSVVDISQDGKMLLVVENAQGSVLGDYCYLRNVDASEPVRLGDGLPIAFSPDDQWVLAFSNKSIVLLPIGPGQHKVLTLKPDLRDVYPILWFPDGKRILIEANIQGSDNRGLYAVDIDSGKANLVAPEGFSISEEAPGSISPDGKFLVGARAGQKGKLYLYSLEKKEFQHLAAMAPQQEPIQWSDDGSYIYVARRDQVPFKIFRFHIPSGTREPWKTLIPNDPSAVKSIKVVLTPDAKYLAYTYYRNLRQLFLVEGLK